MGIARSTFYDMPDTGVDDATVVAQMKAICDEFETYGYRRVDAELRHRGIVVNAKKVRRLMREHALNPKQRRRFIATTDSDHNDPICPNLATSMTLNGPNQLWVADCQSALDRDPRLECAPDGGQVQAAVLTGCWAWRSSYCAGLR